MTYPDQCPFVSAPLAARHTHQPVIGPFFALNNTVGLPECGPEGWCHGGAIRVVLDAFTVGGFGIEVFEHVAAGELAEGASLDVESFEDAVEGRQACG